jgi:hypothetical protein
MLAHDLEDRQRIDLEGRTGIVSRVLKNDTIATYCVDDETISIETNRPEEDSEDDNLQTDNIQKIITERVHGFGGTHSTILRAGMT